MLTLIVQDKWASNQTWLSYYYSIVWVPLEHPGRERHVEETKEEQTKKYQWNQQFGCFVTAQTTGNIEWRFVQRIGAFQQNNTFRSSQKLGKKHEINADRSCNSLLVRLMDNGCWLPANATVCDHWDRCKTCDSCYEPTLAPNETVATCYWQQPNTTKQRQH